MNTQKTANQEYYSKRKATGRKSVSIWLAPELIHKLHVLAALEGIGSSEMVARIIMRTRPEDRAGVLTEPF
jgi:hypothetical protein